MNGCQGNTSLCNGRTILPVKLGLRRTLLLMCEGCRSTALAVSVIVERRETDLPVLTERRRSFRPAWLANLRGRDESGRLSA